MSKTRLWCGVLAALLAAGCGDEESSEVKLFLNEVVAANASGATDEAGELDDWIELYNGGAEALDLEGFAITDDPEVPLKKRFGKGLVVPAGGVLVLWADDAPEQGEAHLPFKLKAAGEKLQLFDAGGAVADEYEWATAIDDVAFARFPDGDGAWAVCPAPTFGAVNGAACSR